MGRRYRRAKRIHEQIWGVGGLYCYEGLPFLFFSWYYIRLSIVSMVFKKHAFDLSLVLLEV